MKKILSFLLCLCMVLAVIPQTVAFAATEDSGALELDASNQALCPACNETVTWTAYSGSKRLGSFTDGKHRHYYLSGDVTAQTITASLFRQASGSNVCLHLNGHNIITGAYIQVDASTLNIMGTGNVTFTATSTGDAGYRKYGFFNNGTINLMGGSYAVADAALETGVPVIYQTNGTTVLGDVTMTGLADIIGGSLKLQKSANLESIRIDADSKLTVAAGWTGTAQVSFDAGLTDNFVPAANGAAEGTFTGKLTLADGALLRATTDGRLFVPDFSADLILDENNQAVCPACEAVVTWTAYSGSNRLGSFTDGKHRHYYLSGDVTAQTITASLFRQASGSNVCLHLNGHDIITGAYIQVQASTLNVMGTGNVTFTATSTGDAGYRKYGFFISGTVNLMGGSYSIADAALETGIPIIYQTSGDTVLRDVSVSGKCELRGGSLTLDKGLNFTGSITKLVKNGGTVILTSDFALSNPLPVDAASAVTTLCAATAQQGTMFIGAGNRSVTYDGSNVVFTDPTVQLCGETTADYGSLWAAMQVMTEGQYVKLVGDTTENITVSDTLYLDLNGHTLTGAVTGEGTLFGMDSATDKYVTDTMGRITGTVSCKVETQFKTNITGLARRYMAIADENGYTFHRFYMGITHISLKPGAGGVGYKAAFYGDEQVRAQVVGYGYTLWAGENGKKLSAGKEGTFHSGKTVTARLQNFDVAAYGETPIYGQVYLTLTDGTTITSAQSSFVLRSMVEQIAANAVSYTESQLAALRDMLNQFEDAVSDWNIAGLYQ